MFMQVNASLLMSNTGECNCFAIKDNESNPWPLAWKPIALAAELFTLILYTRVYIMLTGSQNVILCHKSRLYWSAEEKKYFLNVWKEKGETKCVGKLFVPAGSSRVTKSRSQFGQRLCQLTKGRECAYQTRKCGSISCRLNDTDWLNVCGHTHAQSGRQTDRQTWSDIRLII